MDGQYELSVGYIVLLGFIIVTVFSFKKISVLLYDTYHFVSTRIYLLVNLNYCMYVYIIITFWFFLIIAAIFSLFLKMLLEEEKFCKVYNADYQLTNLTSL